MSEAEFAAFVDYSAQGYAAANVESGRWSEAEAMEMARGQIKSLLPDGRATHEKWILNIIDDQTGETVGYIFFAITDQGGLRGGYIYDFEIYPPHRRQGYAGAALSELEVFASGLGLPFIDLHVFGENAGAIALYDSQGFNILGMNMRKVIGRS